MPENDFESKLHQLTYQQIAGAAPRLVPAMVAFELLNVNDDETEAQAIYAFRVGKQLVYVPVFYTNGKLEGLNLCYVANDDLFLPLQESWVDYLFSRQPATIGAPSDDKHIEGNGPMFDSLRDVFGAAGKSASADTYRKVASIVFNKGELVTAADRCDLGNALVSLHKSAAANLLTAMTANDEFGRAVLKFYPMEKLAEIADKLEKKSPKKYDAELQPGRSIAMNNKPVVLRAGDKRLRGLGVDVGNFDDLRRYGVAVLDNRKPEEVTKVKRTSVPTSWFTPMEAGLYEIVRKDGKVVKAVLFTSMLTIGEGSVRGSVIVDTENKTYQVGSPVACQAVKELSQDWNDYFESLPKVSSLDVSTKSVMIVNSRRQASIPAKIVFQSSKGDTKTFYANDCSCFSSVSAPGTTGVINDGFARNSSTCVYDAVAKHEYLAMPLLKKDKYGHTEYGRPITIVDGADDRMVQSGSTLMIGPNCRYISLDQDTTDANLILLPTDSLLGVVKSAGYSSKLTVTSRHGEYTAQSGFVSSGRLSRPNAMAHLITVHGLDKSAAVQVLLDADAAEAKLKPAVFAVKYAASFPNVQTHAGTEFGVSQVQTATGEQQADPGNELDGMLQQDVERAISAAQTGQKSVFDTAVLMGLLRQNDPNAAVSDLLGDLTLGLDRIGRLLFVVYAHRPAFEEEYESADISRIVDSLESLFKELGEVILFFKRKSGNPIGDDKGSLGLID